MKPFAAAALAAAATAVGLAAGLARAYDRAHPPLAPAAGTAVVRPAAAAEKRVDLNRASRAELKTLPGIGDAQAERIVAGRPYKSKTDLVTRNVLELAAYDQVRRQVVVDHRQAAPRPQPATPPSRAAASKPAS